MLRLTSVQNVTVFRLKWDPGGMDEKKSLRCLWETMFPSGLIIVFEVLGFPLTWGECFAEKTVS